MSEPDFKCGEPQKERPESEDGTCPACKSTNVTFGYGLAAGGMGSYMMCLEEDCDGGIFDFQADAP